MRRWWKALGVLAGGLVSLGGIVSSAGAQFPSPGPGGYGMPPGGGMMAPPPGMMPGMGMPAGMTGPPAGMMMGGSPAPGMFTGGGPPPGAFGGNPDLGGQPADFPNPAVPSQEPASPFSLKDEGLGGAFTELNDPRARIPQPYTFVFRGEYLGWWIRKANLNTDLVTTTSNFPNEFGALNQPNTTVLVPAGGTAIDYGLLTGYRASLGLAVGFLPPIEVTGFSFNRNLTLFDQGSNDATGQFLARPVQITNLSNGPNAGTETVETFNIPGVINGNISIVSRLSLWNVDVNTFFNFIDTKCLKVDLLLGYRHSDLYESLDINASSGGFIGQVVFDGALQPAGFSVLQRDFFTTRNAFDGGQVGFRTILSFDKLSLFSDIKVAMGPTEEFLTIFGDSTLFQGIGSRPTTTLPGGLLALPSNIGTSTRNEFSVITEANLSLSYQLTPHIRLFGGYNVLNWSSVARPGDHLNSVIDARGVPTAGLFAPGSGTAPTTPPIVLRDFWGQGFNAGIEFAF